jgi:hypothetical protein
MRAENKMIALREASTTSESNFEAQPHSGILSEKSAIAICGLGVAVFAIPILVVIEILSGLYWGGVTVYQFLNGSGLDKMDDI